MDLKFTFGGASPDQHDHGGAPSGIPLPFAGASSSPVSTSNELDVLVRLVTSPEGSTAIAEVVTGDGVTYTRSEVELGRPRAVGGPLPVDSAEHIDPADIEALTRAVRSAISRAVAGLEGPLASAITAIELDLPGGAAVVAALGAAPAPMNDPKTAGTITDALQARFGIAAGTPIRLK
ncbi:hypothetical protein ACF07D_00545 [Leucobacter sp. NPDC015123]|uniref:hypothetical protein n=1 Tax=Leucobacter sp. NPDC015123 TaxID=3364129 RepID=UPI0036F4A3A8